MELLAEGSTNVTETVYATGFESPSAFISAFRGGTLFAESVAARLPKHLSSASI